MIRGIINSAAYYNQCKPVTEEIGHLGNKTIKKVSPHITQNKQLEMDSNVASKIYLAAQAATAKVDMFLCPLIDTRLYPNELHKYIEYKNNIPFIRMGPVYARVFDYTNQRIIVFYGLESWKGLNFVSKNIIGSGKKEMDNASFIVNAFKKKSQNGQLIVVGHSMGSAFATYAGAKLDIMTVNFNGLGLSHRTVKKLEKNIRDSNIIHVNSKNDWVNKKINPNFKLTQIGQRFYVDNYEKHNLVAKDQSILTALSEYIKG